MLKIAVLVSGGGSNLQAIIDKVSDGYLDKVAIEYVISDTKGAYALERAEKVGIKTLTYDKKEYGDSLSKKILDTLKGKVDVIVLAGFFSIIKKERC